MKKKLALNNFTINSFVTEISAEQKQTIIAGGQWLNWENSATLEGRPFGGIGGGSTPACTTGCKSGVQV